MAKIFNEKDTVYDLRSSPIPEFLWHTSPNLAKLSKAEHLQFDIRSLDPDKYSYPYHFHRNAEELFIILSGQATLRTPEGFKVLSEGDIIFFEKGSTGAHQLYNHTEQPCRFLDIRTNLGFDVCEYPDSSKVNILPYREVYKKENQVDYYFDEDKVAEKWPAEIVKKP